MDLQEIAKRLNESIKVNPVTAGIFEQLEQLLERSLLLQKQIDENVEDLVKHFNSVTEYSQAANLTETYNYAWFCRSLYSYEILQQIAFVLETNCAPYLGENLLWQKISAAELELDLKLPPTQAGSWLNVEMPPVNPVNKEN